MKILFVFSGNSKDFDVAPFIRSQAKSIRNIGADVDYFPIYGKGILGYLKASFKLRKWLKKNPVDIIHVHYTLSGWSAVLSFCERPIVLSLMGTDAYGEYIGINKIKFISRYLVLLTYIIQPFVNSIICKSKHIETFVYLKNKSYVIPNGILLDEIKPQKKLYKEELGLKPNKKYVLFLGNKLNPRKNYKLAEDALNLINSDEVSLIAPYPVAHEKVEKYLNSVDALVVPSLVEGSPNVVKEAMACNCPVVATEVGDIAWLFGNEPGHFLTGFDRQDVAKNIQAALEFSEKHGRTNGRDRIIELGLDAESVAKRIVGVYEEVLAQRV